ncbi:plasmid partitioning protein RepB [Pseudooceanicola sp. CBS1P-1]|uniref:Plasmid partitioning protein RepB n=1 Tax=Pseudooceanicola albus TaxID=2692189 RepID=A0A6L7G4S7_9RHOB|nr:MULTISPECIES: plasmid partitioning protein RepB [Pseudooceanicola]MBT9386813.1 plasmid partitioning protein RepB [Pseudooceanicola endophyticus]MXN19364.1 plasmid partitioning protein RepB [Pseudooceanicola albus]
MADNRKKRMSLLDSLAAAGSAPPDAGSSMMSSNRALRSARDAVDAHHVWDLDPESITDDRLADRLDPKDVADLRTSIETNGQAVPILVRRDPAKADRYLLIYGRRRLEAVRSSDRVTKVRAMIAHMDDRSAVRVQVAENTERRDLSFIERALFAKELLDNGFGTQSQVAEVLNVTKSAVSMALSVARAIGPELARAIGPAAGIGRPRWEALVQDLQAADMPVADLIELAEQSYAATDPERADPSVQAFETVARRLHKAASPARPAKPRSSSRQITLDGQAAGKISRTRTGLRLDITAPDDAFADWLADQAPALIEELRTRWKNRD